MRRKVIKQGTNTLTLTLPSKWAKKFGVEAGSEIDVREKGKEIVVSPDAKEQFRRISIDITGMNNQTVWRHLSSAYRSGYDEIEVTFDSKAKKGVYTAFTYNTLPIHKRKDEELSPIEAVQALVNRFIGVEIIDQGRDHCIIREMGGSSQEDFDDALKRIFHLLQTMSDKLYDAVNGEKEELNEILIVDTNLDRFEDFCLRVLNKYGYGDYKKTNTMYSLVFLLELIGDEFKKVSLHFLNMKKIGKDVKHFLDHVNEICETYYELHKKFSSEKVAKILDMNMEIPKLYDKHSQRISSEEIEILHHLKKIGRFVNSLVELRIDLEYME